MSTTQLRQNPSPPSRTLLGLVFLSLIQAAACNLPPSKTLVAASAQARQGASEFKKAFPNTRFFFSQNTGEILWLDGGGAPLAHGSVESAEKALSVVQNFMISNPNLYRVADPLVSLRSTEVDLRTTGAAQGVLSLRFTEIQKGLPVLGKYGLAIFNPAGELLGLESRLLPTEQFQISPTISQAETTASTSQGLTLQGNPNDRFAPLLQRQVWDKKGDGTYRRIHERLERSGLHVTRTLLDGETGEMIQSWDETPSDLTTAPDDWALNSVPEWVPARDARGNSLEIPSTLLNGTLVLGFALPGIHAPGKAVFIGDSGVLSDHSKINVEPIATSDASWILEPAFDPRLDAATTLALHIHATLNWYLENLGRASWDGQGASLFASIRGESSLESDTKVNAWGGGGTILIGSGLSETGQPLSDALDIVAHEFTHSVIDATAAFEYHDESGALNESLADIFGKSVEGWPDTIEGKMAGVHFRDLANPAGCAPDCAQPSSYGEYQLMDEASDHAGVHMNSGIMNRALSQVILKSGPATKGERAIALTGLILDSMKQMSYATDSALEEFSAVLTGYCLARKSAATLQRNQVELCGELETSFRVSELLGSPL